MINVKSFYQGRHETRQDIEEQLLEWSASALENSVGFQVLEKKWNKYWLVVRYSVKKNK